MGSTIHSDTQVNGSFDEGIKETSSSIANDKSSHNSESEDEIQAQARYPFHDSPEIEGNALIGPEKWGSKYLAEALKKEPESFDTTQDARKTENTDTPSKSLDKKRINKSAQRLADELGVVSKNLSQRQGTKKNENPLPPIKEFELNVMKSILNHQAYIERQAYYAGFNPDMRTIMAEDLKGRVPLEGLLDCSLTKPDVPLRVRLRRKETARSPISLMDLWEKGRRKRGEV